MALAKFIEISASRAVDLTNVRNQTIHDVGMYSADHCLVVSMCLCLFLDGLGQRWSQ